MMVVGGGFVWEERIKMGDNIKSEKILLIVVL